MPKFRIFLGFLACGLAIGYLVFTFIAYESKGRISAGEFIQVSSLVFLLALFISLWAFWRGDAEDRNDKKRDEPNIF